MRHIPARATTAAPATAPTVSVVVPCYNYGHYLRQCVASILDQPDVLANVIIVDDASTDDSAAVAQSLADADPRIRLIRHAANKGHIATYNDGLAEVAGTYCTLLSADDLLVPGALARATALLEAHPNVGLVYGHRIPITAETLPAAHTDVQGWSIWAGEEWVARLCRLGSNVLASPEVLLRSRVQAEIGGYNARLPHSGDLEMWLRAASVADVARIDGADHAYYREHATSMSRSTYYTVPLSDLEARNAAFTSAFDGSAGRLPRAGRLRSQARRALAGEALDLATGMQHDSAPAELVDSARCFAVQVDPAVKHSLRYQALTGRARVARYRIARLVTPIDRFLVRVRKRIVWGRRQHRLREVASLPLLRPGPGSDEPGSRPRFHRRARRSTPQRPSRP